MKKYIFVLVFTICSAVCFAEDWTLTNGSLWSRDSGAATKTVEKATDRDDREVIRIQHTGNQDWALSESRQIPVQPGDVYELTAVMKSEAVPEKWATVSISVVTRKKDGEVVQWSYGTKGVSNNAPWTSLKSTFIIPPEIESIEPRIVGNGPLTIGVDGFSAKKTGHRNLDFQITEPIKRSNRFLEVDFEPALGVFSVTDKRTGRTWKPQTEMRNFIALPQKIGKGQSFSLLNTETLLEYGIAVDLEKDSPEFTVLIQGNGPMEGNIVYPPPFVSQPGDRLVIPMNEGISYPVEATQQGLDIKVGRLIAYGGHGICMAFWGQIEDATGAGMMGILETPDDASINIERKENELLRVGAVWEPSMKEFRYPRKLRYVFFDKGGHVAVCKRYRDYAKQIGLFVPFTEKVKKNPKIDILLGAVNLWCWDWDWMKNRVAWKGKKLELIAELKSLGFDRILWSGGGNGEELAAMNEIPNVLTSRYDIYQDIMDPAHFDKVWVHGDWTTDAWPHDINWADSDGTWRKGWYVDQKDKTQPRIPCAVICDAKAVPYARKRISKELETKPFTARFIDTTVAAPWFECYHPDHPMTRSDSRKHKMELLKLIGDLGLVCGSETGHDASVPFCDFFEGMLSLGPYRVHESGRNMPEKIEEVPPQIENFQVNPALRLPLWELVYHDCTVAHWYWGDYNNKLPKVWRKRDLFNALYGTPPMYMFNKEEWEEQKERFVESNKTANGTARATAYAEMTDHRILSEDRNVQQTVFSNGVVVTVNFGDKSFTMSDGSTIDAMNWKMKQ